MLDKRVRWLDIFNYLTKEPNNLIKHFGQKYHTLLKEVIDYTTIFLEEVKLHLSEKTALFIPPEEKEKLRPRLTERTGEQINHLLTATGTALQAGFLFLLEPHQQRIYLSLPQQKANRSAIFDYLTTSRKLLRNIFFMKRETYDSVLERVTPGGPGDSKGTVI